MKEHTQFWSESAGNKKNSGNPCYRAQFYKEVLGENRITHWTGLEWVADQQWLNTIENNEFAQTQKLDGVVQVGLDLFHK